jgi:serine/threonine protein kinase/tetratricopeptide (TPR) repeat protein
MHNRDASPPDAPPSEPANAQRTIVHVGPAPAPAPEQRRVAQALAKPVVSLAPSEPTTTTRDPFAPGHTVPGTRYRVIRRIGDGGMGTVYEAEHVDIERRCALKVLKPEFTRSPIIVEQFRREARAASRVGAEQIVQVFDFAELPDGRVMFTMDLVRGDTLREELRHGPLSPNRVVGILRQICKGLHAAHAAGVVHRDVKPDNIVLERRMGRVDAVKLLDFGIASMVGEEGGPLSAGTPHYLAPELVTGASFDRRADIYAVGCTAYEMLTGRTPFGNRGEQVDEVLGSQLADIAPPPSQVRPDLKLPPALDRVIMKCLAKRADQRFRNMGELEASLCAAQVDATLQTSWDDLPLPDEVDDDLRDRLLRDMPDMHETEPRRRRWLVPVIATLSLAIGIGATYFALSKMRESTVAVPSKVDGIVADARAAAARTAFVYPPADEPEAKSAFSRIRELEQLGTEEARAAALALRGEFATTLVQLGDSYWDRAGGQTFAVEYYKQALVFERDNARALERGATAPEQVDALAQRAEVGEFSAQELATAESLRELAEPDPVRRKELRARRAAQGDSTVAALLDKPAAAAVASKEEEPIEPDDEKAADGTPTTEVAAKTPAVDASEQTGAEDLAKTGAKLLKQGKKADAEEMFRLALTYDPNNATALRAMYKLDLDRGNVKAATAHADLLLASAPKDPANHVRVGDMCMKQQRYDDARTHYRRALELGASEAKTKLAKLDAISPPPPVPTTPPKAEDDEGEDEAEEPAPAEPKAPAEPETKAKSEGQPVPKGDTVPTAAEPADAPSPM